MSAPDRRAMVERSGKDLSVRRQCALVGVARSGIYRPKRVAGAVNMAVMRRIRRTASRTSVSQARGESAFELNKEGRGVDPQAGAAADAGEWGSRRWSQHNNPRPAQDIPLPAARPEDCRAEPRVGRRRDLHPDGMRPLSGGDTSTGPAGSGVAAVEHQRCELLRGGAGGGAPSVRNAAGFSIPIRAPRSSPPRLSPRKAASWTTFSSNGCGARSSMKKCI